MSLTGEDSDEDEFHEINARNFQRACDGVSKLGYADGVEEGEKSAFQEGFDNGYGLGLRAGFENAKYKSFFNTIQLLKEDVNQQFHEEADKYRAMTAQDPTRDYQIQQITTESLDSSRKNLNANVDKHLEHLKQILPAATKCLSNP